MHIISGITSLMQYQLSFNNNPGFYRLEQCLCCGRANPHRHGCYPREADRINKSSDSLNPVFIQRYYCPKCRKTSSVLPECIPRHRWYLWDMQQVALILCLGGNSLCAAARALIPSRQTICRWMKRFKEQFHLHKDVLSHHVTQLGRVCGFINYWHKVFEHINLDQAMRLCHVNGVVIP